MKASPLLRAWLGRLAMLGVVVTPRARWTGWDEQGRLRFDGHPPFGAAATLLALGGASWPRLGADGGWTALLPGIVIHPLRPANCGFEVAWSAQFQQKFAGQPVKSIELAFAGRRVKGDAMITRQGIEGGAIYALSAALREHILAGGSAGLTLDLRPDIPLERLRERLAGGQGGLSLANFLRKKAGLAPVAIGVVMEILHQGAEAPLAELIKALPLSLIAPFGIERAISTAGGIALAELDDNLMLRRHPGVFAAGEMLDWEAPTGGYLLQACLATGRADGLGLMTWLQRRAEQEGLIG